MKPNRLIYLNCELCSKKLDGKLIIATQCFHRFCASCTMNQNICPKCGAGTKFQLDSNFSQLFSKMKDHNKIMKRRIIDVLKNDGIDLAHQNQQNERLSSLTTLRTNITPLKRFKPENSAKLSPSNANEPSTSYSSASLMATNGNFLKHNQMKKNNAILSVGELQRSANYANFTHRQVLNRTRMEAIVLWPDGTNYKIRELPKCLLRPRYLFIPTIATVGHLIEYLFKRAELEAGVELRSKYRIEFMPVEDEGDEINLWVNPMRNIDYLSKDFKSNMEDSNTNEYVLILRKNQEDSYFSTNLIMQHPFKALDAERIVSELLNERRNGTNGSTNFVEMDDGIEQQQREIERRPPKFTFRFVLFVQNM